MADEALPLALRGDAVVPQFLTAADDPWLHLLLEELGRFAGRPRRELDAHLRAGLPFAAPPAKLKLALACWRRLGGAEVAAELSPRRARRLVFAAAAGRPNARAAVLAEVGAELGLEAAALEAALLADLPGERRVTLPEEPLGVAELRVQANLRLVQSLLQRSHQVRLQLEGNARPVLRQAKMRGLICTVVADAAADTVRLELSGPLALFQRTLLYGRALAELVPQLCWCNRFYLEADLVLDGAPRRLILASGAPIFPGRKPRRFDSQVEARLHRDLGRLAVGWDIIREPEPLPVGRALVFPDFALVRRAPPHERWYLEIVGFWTADYLRRKLATLTAARLERLVLCLDAARACDDAALPPGARVLRYNRHVDAAAVLALLEGRPADAGTSP